MEGDLNRQRGFMAGWFTPQGLSIAATLIGLLAVGYLFGWPRLQLWWSERQLAQCEATLGVNAEQIKALKTAQATLLTVNAENARLTKDLAKAQGRAGRAGNEAVSNYVERSKRTRELIAKDPDLSAAGLSTFFREFPP